LVSIRFCLLVMYRVFEPSYGGYQTFEIRHNYPCPGFSSDGAQFTTQSNCSINPAPLLTPVT
jgi:hypothetical protein